MADDDITEQFLGLLEKYSAPEYVCARHEIDTVHRLGEAIQHVLSNRAFDIIDNHLRRPVMSCYMSDGWSVFTQSVKSTRVKGLLVKVSGRFKHEFLLERGIVRRKTSGGEDDVAVVLEPPRSLRYGKGAWQMFSSGCASHIKARARGHEGIVWNVYLMDGALFSSTLPKWEALHELWYDLSPEPECETARSTLRRLRNTELTVGMHCKTHGGHKAIEWGMAPYKPDDTSDKAHIAIKSVINGSSAIFAFVDLWIVRYVRFHAKTGTLEQRRAFWEKVSIHPDWLDWFTKADPWWSKEDGCCYVSEEVRHERYSWQTIVAMVLICRRNCQWADTRWGKSWRSGRYFIRNIGTGLDSAVQMVIDGPTVSNAYIGGYKERCDADVRRMMGIVGLAAIPCETFVISMLEDSPKRWLES